MQTYVSMPLENGYYGVARWDLIKKEYIPIRGEWYYTEGEAQARACQLNIDNDEDNKSESK